MAAERELGFVAELERLQTLLLEPSRLGLGDRLAGEIRERLAAPETERRAEVLRRVGRLSRGERRAGPVDEALEPV